MARNTMALGRGLDSLFEGVEEWESNLQEIAIGELDPNPDQARKTFRDESLTQLADSIREQGVLLPLLVTATPGGRYRIIAGERRYRASRLAGLEKVPCIVKDLDIIHQMEVSLIENLQREDLNPMEAARGIRALMDQCGYTQEKVSARLGKSRPAVANLLRLLTLPDEVCEMVRDGLLSAGHARVLAGVTDREEIVRLARRAADEGMSVRQLEMLTSKARPKTRKKSGSALSPEMNELRERILEKTGLRSTLTGTDRRGKITLQYSSREELERFNELLERL